jgi:hypothetical protein
MLPPYHIRHATIACDDEGLYPFANSDRQFVGGGINMELDLNFQQTRRMYVAGTVAFPLPFPSVGGISI